MEFSIKVYSKHSEPQALHGYSYVGDVLVSLPPVLAETVEEDLRYVGLMHPELTDVVDYGSFGGEILRIGKSLLKMGAVKNSRDYMLMKEGYDIVFEPHAWVV